MIGQWEWVILMVLFVALLGWELRSVRRSIRDAARTTPPKPAVSPPWTER